MFAEIFITCAISLIFFFGMIDDHLLHHSDTFSFLFFILGAIALLGTCVGLFTLLIQKFLSSKKQKVFSRLVTSSALALMLTAIGIFLLESIWRIPTPIGLLIVILVIWAGLATHFFRSKNDDIFGRFRGFAKISSIFALSLFFVGIVYQHSKSFLYEKDSSEERHFVLIVIDRYPIKFIKSYNPEIPESGFDRLAQKGSLFTNARTNTIWTNGFHSAIFTGKRRFSFKAGSKNELSENLLNELQKKDVGTRWITFHNNGIPEGSRVSNYNGLRSLFLNESLVWVPRFLGLDYNVFLNQPGGRGLTPGTREKFILDNFQVKIDQRILLAEKLVSEAKQLRYKYKKTFLSFHIDESMGLIEPFGKDIDKFDYSKMTPTERFDFRMNIRRKDHIYYAKTVGDSIEKFAKNLEKEGLLKNTTILVTSDHGSVFRKDKQGYQFHHDEEAFRVPLLVVGNQNLKRVDARTVETIDITESILNYFGVEKSLDESGQAISIFSNKEKTEMIGATYPSVKKPEWFFNFYSGNKKQVLNFSRKSDGEIHIYETSGFNERLIKKTTEVDQELKSKVKSAIKFFGLNKADIHPSFLE